MIIINNNNTDTIETNKISVSFSHKPIACFRLETHKSYGLLLWCFYGGVMSFLELDSIVHCH